MKLTQQRARTMMLLFFSAAAFVTCKTKASLQTAQTAFNQKEYSTALGLYKTVYNASADKNEKEEAGLKVAQTYTLLDDPKNAEIWYKKINATNKDAAIRLELARTYAANEKYNEAIAEYEWYKKNAATSPQIEKELEGCVNALKWKNQKTRYVVINEKTINTEYAEYAPSYGKKGVLYFTSDRVGTLNSDVYEYTGKMYSDIYSINYKRNTKTPTEVKYEKINPVPGINTKFNDGVSTYDTKQNIMIYTICNDKNGKGMKCNLYTSFFDGTSWTESVILPFCIDSFNSGQPALNKDGNVLYFSSDMPGGFGGKDLYKVNYNKKNKTWGEPVNLGASVNTDKNEVFPFIHSNGTLYFSSDGYAGMGRLDLFFSKPSGDGWSTPVNMKSPLNSGGDDFAIVLDESTENGYFSSNREGGRGKDDIYRFYMTPLLFNISGVVKDKETGKPVANSSIALFSSKDSSSVVITTDDKGYYKTTLVSNSDYRMVGSKPEDYYLDSKEESISTKGYEASEDFEKDLFLEPLKIEDEFTLEGIYYDIDKSELRPASKVILDTLITLLNKYPKIKIEIGSHTDCRSDSSYNQQLSARRAQSVVDYLIEKQVKPARLEAMGYGETRLVNDCGCEGATVTRVCSDEEHQKNRRTTFKILSKDYLKK